ncbi:MAG TPA: hypothetical protein VGR57_18500, partial [Ktedonobacterales bacterium]|nr:hypothetical protein [Ktedonobacterales bacterium]
GLVRPQVGPGGIVAGALARHKCPGARAPVTSVTQDGDRSHWPTLAALAMLGWRVAASAREGEENMRTRLARPGAALALAALLLASLAACKVVTQPQAPGAMDISIELQRFVQGQTHVVVHFATASGNTVEFVSGETVACNGTFLRYDLGSYTGDVPREGDGGTYTVTYTPAASAVGTPGATASSGPISVAVAVVPAAVTVSQPAPGASVPLNAPLNVIYQPSQLGNTAINAIVADGRAHFDFTWPGGETGTLGIPADKLSGLQAGPGTLTVVRDTQVYPSGTPFHSVVVHFKNITQIPVTWQ